MLHSKLQFWKISKWIYFDLPMYIIEMLSASQINIEHILSVLKLPERLKCTRDGKKNEKTISIMVLILGKHFIYECINNVYCWEDYRLNKKNWKKYSVYRVELKLITFSFQLNWRSNSTAIILNRNHFSRISMIDEVQIAFWHPLCKMGKFEQKTQRFWWIQ